MPKTHALLRAGDGFRPCPIEWPRIRSGSQRGNAETLSGQACLAAELTGAEDSYDGFLPVFGIDRDFGFAGLDEEYGIRCITLSENDFALVIVGDGHAGSCLCKKVCQIEPVRFLIRGWRQIGLDLEMNCCLHRARRSISLGSFHDRERGPSCADPDAGLSAPDHSACRSD
jgi:hypothetical protein